MEQFTFAQILKDGEEFLLLNAADKVSVRDLLHLSKNNLPTQVSWKSLYSLHVTTHCTTFAQLSLRYLELLHGEEIPIGTNPLKLAPSFDFIAWVYFGTCCNVDASQQHLFSHRNAGDCDTTTVAWDCECDDLYMHLSSEDICDVCGAYRDDSPDARKKEIYFKEAYSAQSRAWFLKEFRNKVSLHDEAKKELCVPVEFASLLPFVNTKYPRKVVLCSDTTALDII